MATGTLIKDKLKYLIIIWIFITFFFAVLSIGFISYVTKEINALIKEEYLLKEGIFDLESTTAQIFNELVVLKTLNKSTQTQKNIHKIQSRLKELQKSLTTDITLLRDFKTDYLNAEINSTLDLVELISDGFYQLANKYIDANKDIALYEANNQKLLVASRISDLKKSINMNISNKVESITSFSEILQAFLIAAYFFLGLVFLFSFKVVLDSLYSSLSALKTIAGNTLDFVNEKVNFIDKKRREFSSNELDGITTLLSDAATVIERKINSEKSLKNNFQVALNEKIKEISAYDAAINDIAMISRTDLNGVITYVNERFCKTMGYKSAQLLGQTHRIIRSEDNPTSLYKEFWSTISKGEKWAGTIVNKNKNGELIYCESIALPIFDKDKNIKEYLSLKVDISESRKLTNEIIATQKDLIFAMGEIGESRSKETGNHVKRVAEYSRLLAELYGLSKEECDTLYNASPMHDIGKVAISDDILKKPGRLTDEERAIMEKHAEIGYNMLKNSNRAILRAAAIVSYGHHEKWGGGGYPRGIKGEEIHIFARITSVADVFDALGSDRVYKKAWELDKILALFEEEKGKMFEPKLVELFKENLDKFLVIREKFE